MSLFKNPRGPRVLGHPVYAYVGPDIVCAWRGREGGRGGKDEDRGNGPLPGARVLRLRDITESRSTESAEGGGW